MTEPSYLTAVRESYDTVAAAYTERVPDPRELDPLSRAMLGAFAELMQGGGGRGPVADLGCGPGKVTAYLAGLGVPAFGVDVSPRMVEVAREAYPELRFLVGSMTALELEDGGLEGILAYYSTHHTPPELLPTVFAEFHRTLAPGGRLFMAGYVGDGERLRPDTAYGGHPVSFTSYLQPADQLAELLEQAGLVVTARLVQAPGGGAKRTVASFLAQKPDAGS
ncbi:methyltransferase domain-containing protein [Streptomyces sp. NPDC050211]|uniref:class I SAM-dependent methyltransferase n=1 Tax=Streptomyces sp. NPDC050211 TaxID=3154932 RepID=UPI0034295823